MPRIKKASFAGYSKRNYTTGAPVCSLNVIFKLNINLIHRLTLL